MPKPSSADPDEIDKFAAMADQWWDLDGPLGPLHALNPVRLSIIRDQALTHFALDRDAIAPLTGLRVLDVGCGGGLICEPLARLGAQVTGLDAAEKTIQVARLHARNAGLAIDYTTTPIRDVRATFDIVLALEIVEHVADPDAFITQCAECVAPGGLLILSTLNRTIKALALAIIGAEYILRWLPRGTHRFDRFLRPSRMRRALRAAGMEVTSDPTGLVYRPLDRCWRQGNDTNVNYMLTASKAVTGSCAPTTTPAP